MFVNILKQKTAAFAGLCALCMTACFSDPVAPPGGTAGGRQGVAVTLQLQGVALAKGAVLGKGAARAGVAAMRPVDSAHVTVTGPGMDTLQFAFPLTEEARTLALLDIPPGADRKFQTVLYHEGRLLYAGVATVELQAGRANMVSIMCLPEFSRVTASIHIPVDFPKTVAGGRLQLWNGGDTLTVDAVANGELRVFRLEEVPGDVEYGLSLALWEPNGDTIATADRSEILIPKGQNVALVLPLALAYTQIALDMTLEDPRTTSLVLSLPGGKRTAAAFGDVIFSELHPVPDPGEGGDDAEWLELFNRTRDTLDISGCLLHRDAATSNAMKFTLPVNTLIPPGRGLVLGRSASVTFAEVTLGSALTLVNTSARLELSCAGTSLDTLHYTTAANDSLAVQVAAGKVSTLRPSALEARHEKAAWCLSVPVGAAVGTGSFAATPGGVHEGCGE